MSQASASSQPPPAATPLMAAMVGLGMVSRRVQASRMSLPRDPISVYIVRDASSRMSAPATKALSPAPVRTMTRTSAADSASRSRSPSRRSVSASSALRTSGRLKVMTTIGPRRSARTGAAGADTGASGIVRPRGRRDAQGLTNSSDGSKVGVSVLSFSISSISMGMKRDQPFVTRLGHEHVVLERHAQAVQIAPCSMEITMPGLSGPT